MSDTACHGCDFSTTGYSFCPDESDCVTTCLAQSSSSTTLDSCTADCQDMCGDYLPAGSSTYACNGLPVYQLGDVRQPPKTFVVPD